MNIQRLNCYRCYHSWLPRSEARPKYCPHCKQPRWDTPARVVEKKEKSSGKIGPALKYDISSLTPGDTKFFQWMTLPSGYPDTIKNGSRNTSLKRYAKRAGWTIQIIPQTKGVLIRRLK